MLIRALLHARAWSEVEATDNYHANGRCETADNVSCSRHIRGASGRPVDMADRKGAAVLECKHIMGGKNADVADTGILSVAANVAAFPDLSVISSVRLDFQVG